MGRRRAGAAGWEGQAGKLYVAARVVGVRVGRVGGRWVGVEREQTSW